MRKPKINYVLIGVSLAIALIAFTMGILRRDEVADPNASWLSNAANSLFMVALVLGPSLVAHELFKRLVPVEELARERRRLRKNIRLAEKHRKRALDMLDQLTLHRDWHRQESTQIKAVYLLAYREAGGTNPDDPPPSPPPQRHAPRPEPPQTMLWPLDEPGSNGHPPNPYQRPS